MTDHTPTPWAFGGGNPSSGWRLHARQGPLDVCPAVAYGLDDAKFILRAVNTYQAMLDALKRIRDNNPTIEEMENCPEHMSHDEYIARTAIDSAEKD